MATVKNKKKVSELLVKLEKSNDSMAKRKIRSDLRKLGHKGGLNHSKKIKKAKVTKKVKKAA